MSLTLSSRDQQDRTARPGSHSICLTTCRRLWSFVSSSISLFLSLKDALQNQSRRIHWANYVAAQSIRWWTITARMCRRLLETDSWSATRSPRGLDVTTSADVPVTSSSSTALWRISCGRTVAASDDPGGSQALRCVRTRAHCQSLRLHVLIYRFARSSTLKFRNPVFFHRSGADLFIIYLI